MTAPLTNLAPAIEFSADRKVIGASPYPTTWQEIEGRFCFNSHRRVLAARFAEWVRAAADVVAPEFVWIGGSFCSDKPEPADVDAVLFYRYKSFMPDPRQRDAFLQANALLLTPALIKDGFGVDGATIALSLPVERLIHISAYWAMVWSNGPDGTRRAFYTLPATSVLAA